MKSEGMRISDFRSDQASGGRKIFRDKCGNDSSGGDNRRCR